MTGVNVLVVGLISPEPACSSGSASRAVRATSASPRRGLAGQPPSSIFRPPTRHLRTADVRVERTGVLVDVLVDEVLDRRSVALAAPADNIEEPDAFRRVDGSSVYSAAGADLYTSQRILDAERRLVIVAERRDGRAVDESAVDWLSWRWRRTGRPWMPGRLRRSGRCDLGCPAAASRLCRGTHAKLLESAPFLCSNLGGRSPHA